MKYELVDSKHPLLKTELEPFDFRNPPIDPTELARNLVETMKHHNGYGLSANQVGLPYRVFVMIGEPNYACFNPKITAYGEEELPLEEGCLSFPGLIVKVKRSRHIRVRFQTPNGEMATRQFTGMTARIFQHELDHLNGKLFFERAHPFHREKAFKKMKKMIA
jgi:peptide deformylase